jgi:hypothetical protein
MYVPMFDQIPKGHVRYCHDFVPVVAVTCFWYLGIFVQGIYNSLICFTRNKCL